MGFEIEEEESIEVVPMVRVEAIPMTLKDAEKAIAQARIDLAVYEDEIKDMTVEAKLLRVESDDAHKKSIELGIRAKRLAGKIDEKADSLREPAKKFDTAIRNFAKVYTTDLLAIEAITKTKNQGYKILKEQREREVQKKINEETERLRNLVNEEAKKAGTKPIEVVTPVIPKTEKIVRTEEGIAYSSEYWKFTAGPVHRNAPDYPGIGRPRILTYAKMGTLAVFDLAGKMGMVGEPLENLKSCLTALNEVKFEIEFDEAGNVVIVSVNDKLIPIIPASLLIPNDKEIRKVVNAGMRVIPGIKIWREDKEIYK